MSGWRPSRGHYAGGFLVIAAIAVLIKALGWLFGWGVLR